MEIGTVLFILGLLGFGTFWWVIWRNKQAKFKAHYGKFGLEYDGSNIPEKKEPVRLVGPSVNIMELTTKTEYLEDDALSGKNDKLDPKKIGKLPPGSKIP